MISYELTIGFSILSVIVCAKSLNLISIVLAQKTIWYCIPLLPIFLIFFSLKKKLGLCTPSSSN